jgi:4-diphosphocytidyl-2C-methyl-D-erythritol kinase
LDKHRTTNYSYRSSINEQNYFPSKNFSWDPPEGWKFFNDFQELFLNHGTGEEKDAYQTILDGLKKAGAAFAGLSGSGSCCFGIFNEPKPVVPAQKSQVLVFHSTFFLRN